MKRIITAFLLSVGLAFGATTTITGPIISPYGGTFSGYVTVRGPMPKTTRYQRVDGTVVAYSETRYTVIAGAFTTTVAIEANDALCPGTACVGSVNGWYSVTFSASTGAYSWSEIWIVPTSLTPVLVSTLWGTQSVGIAPLTGPRGLPGASGAPAGTGAVKVTDGTAGLVSGTASDCVKVDGSSGSCGSAGLADPGSNGVLKRTALNTTAVATAADIPRDFDATREASVLSFASGKCRTREVSWVYAAGSVTLAAATGTGTVRLYCAANGTLYAGHNLDNTKVTCVTCTKVGGVTSFPAGSIPLYAWPVTTDTFDSLTATATPPDYRASLSSSPLGAGTGITITDTGGTATIGVDTAVVTTGVTVNAGTAIVTPNFNGTTPASVSTGSFVGRTVNSNWQAAVSNVSSGTPLRNFRMQQSYQRSSQWLPSGSSTSISIIGDVANTAAGTVTTVAPDNNNGVLLKRASSATTGQAAGLSGMNIWRTGRNLYMSFAGFIAQTTELRAWIGFVNGGGAIADSENGGSQIAAFRFSNCSSGCAGDTNWACWVRNSGAASAAQNSGVPPNTTTAQQMEIAFDDVASTIKFYIDGAQVCNFTAADNLPSANTNMGVDYRVYTHTDTEKDILMHNVYIGADK